MSSSIFVSWPRRDERWKSFQFHIHDFAHYPRGRFLTCPTFTSNGHRWNLYVYPGGDDKANEGYVSAYLCHLSARDITATYAIHFVDKFGSTKQTNISSGFKLNEDWGWKDLIRLSDIIEESQNILDSDGTLTIVVSIKQEQELLFVHPNNLSQMINEMFNDKNTADIHFEVIDCFLSDENWRECGRGKKLKSSVSFHAHRSILRKRAPLLADLFGDNSEASINDVNSSIFYYLLYYVYGGNISKDDLKRNAKEIIEAADKYAIVNLKLAAEVEYVESTDITIGNALDNLQYADSKNCALLKEKVLDFLAVNPNEAYEKISFTDCPGHLVKDLLNAVGRKYKNESNGAECELSTLPVNRLRWKLYEQGLEVDGSRQAVIESLKNNNPSF